MLEKIDPKIDRKSDLDSYKFHYSSASFVDCFVKNGFVILEEILDKSFVENTYSFTSKQYLESKSKFVSKLFNRMLLNLCFSLASKFLKESFIATLPAVSKVFFFFIKSLITKLLIFILGVG